jgi:hypothetical protein
MRLACLGTQTGGVASRHLETGALEPTSHIEEATPTTQRSQTYQGRHQRRGLLQERPRDLAIAKPERVGAASRRSRGASAAPCGRAGLNDKSAISVANEVLNAPEPPNAHALGAPDTREVVRFCTRVISAEYYDLLQTVVLNGLQGIAGYRASSGCERGAESSNALVRTSSGILRAATCSGE